MISEDFQDAESVRSGNSPRYQSTSVFPTSSNSWRNAQPFYKNAEPQRMAGKHLGHTCFIGKRFCKSRWVIISTLSTRIASMEFIDRRAAPKIHSGEKRKARTISGSEMPVWTASQNPVTFSGGDSSKNFGSDRQRLHISDLQFEKFPTPATFACWKKIQDWGMYLLTISYGSFALGQRSGDVWFSGWFDVVINKRNSNAKFWSTRCEDCFSTEQNHP